MYTKDCSKCIHNAVCETAKACDGYVYGCKHFKEQKSGRWIEDGYYGNPFVCSHCGCEGCYSGDYRNKQYYYTNFCPHCGAKMDGDGNV